MANEARVTRHVLQVAVSASSEAGMARVTRDVLQVAVAAASETGPARVTREVLQVAVSQASEAGMARVTRTLLQVAVPPEQFIGNGAVRINLIVTATGTNTAPNLFADRTLLAGDYQAAGVVQLQDSTGTWIDVNGYYLGGRWNDNIDQPCPAGSFRFAREVSGVSLAPLIGASALNAPTPLLDIARGIRIWTATTPRGTAAAFPADYWLAFDGIVDDMDWAAPEVSVSARDIVGRVIDRSIRTAATYGSTGGTPFETVLAQLLADNGALMPLDIGASPGFNLYTFTQQVGSLHGALVALASQIGWVVRRVRITKTDIVYMFFPPPRAKTAADFTLPPSEYLAVTVMSTSASSIRNVVRVEYGNALFLEVTDPDSVTRYGQRFIVLGRDQTARITSEAQAYELATSVLTDLRLPFATHSIKTLYLPFVALYQLIALPANSRHYDADQLYGVVAYEHDMPSPGVIFTTIATRGKIAGSYSDWFRAAAATSAASTPVLVPTPTPTPTPTTGWISAYVNAPTTFGAMQAFMSYLPAPTTYKATITIVGGATSTINPITSGQSVAISGQLYPTSAHPTSKLLTVVIDALNASGGVISTITISQNYFI